MINVKETIAEFETYLDRFGLIQPEADGRTSWNGVRFTCETIMAFEIIMRKEPALTYSDVKMINEFIHDRAFDLNDCFRVIGTSYVLDRWPRSREQNSIDDYSAMFSVASNETLLVVFETALERMRNGIRFFPNDKPLAKAWLGRFPQIFANLDYALGLSPRFIDWLFWVGAVIHSAFSKGQDNKMLGWHLVRVGENRNAINKLACVFWRRKLRQHYPRGLGEVMGNYFHPAHFAHPLAKLLLGRFG